MIEEGATIGCLVVDERIEATVLGANQDAWLCTCACGRVVLSDARGIEDAQACPSCSGMRCALLSFDLDADGVSVPRPIPGGTKWAFVWIDSRDQLILEVDDSKAEALSSAASQRTRNHARLKARRRSAAKRGGIASRSIVAIRVVAVYADGTKQQLKELPSSQPCEVREFQTDTDDVTVWIYRRPVAEAAEPIVAQCVCTETWKEPVF